MVSYDFQLSHFVGSSFISAGQLFQPHRRTSGGFRVGGGVHDSYTFQCRLVGSFTSPGIDTR